MDNSENKYKILIIDDHPLIAESYKQALTLIHAKKSGENFDIEVFHDIQSSLTYINSVQNSQSIELVVLDISLPTFKGNEVLSGEDIGLKIRESMPETKILISTSLNDNHRIYNIIKSINPEGFIIKVDVTSKELMLALQKVLDGASYYSKTVLELVRKQFSTNLVLDRVDRKILYHISIGFKTKDLCDVVPLSIAGIEKRKRHLKEIFDVKSGSDNELITLAKEKGFI